MAQVNKILCTDERLDWELLKVRFEKRTVDRSLDFSFIENFTGWRKKVMLGQSRS